MFPLHVAAHQRATGRKLQIQRASCKNISTTNTLRNMKSAAISQSCDSEAAGHTVGLCLIKTNERRTWEHNLMNLHCVVCTVSAPAADLCQYYSHVILHRSFILIHSALLLKQII